MGKIIVFEKNLFINVDQIIYCEMMSDGVKIVTDKITLNITNKNPNKLYNLIKCFIIDNTENYVLKID